jgi:hypothetical protein
LYKAVLTKLEPSFSSVETCCHICAGQLLRASGIGVGDHAKSIQLILNMLILNIHDGLKRVAKKTVDYEVLVMDYDGQRLHVAVIDVIAPCLGPRLPQTT